MVRFASKAILTFAAVFSMTAAWAQSQPAEKQWKDRAEFDLFEAIRQGTDPAKRLQLLNTWKEKYPTTDYKLERLRFYMETYQGLNQGNQMLETALEIITNDPKNVLALYWSTVLTVSLNNTAAARLDSGEKSAKGLLAVLDETFASGKRPQTTSEEAWKKERLSLEVIGYNTLGWVAMSRKNFEDAEKAFTRLLDLTPNNGQVSYWLGTVVAGQKKIEKQAAALFHFARASNYTGQGELPEASRKQIQAFLEKQYTNYHGDRSGLDEFIALAKASPFPPADLKIKSAAEIAIEKEEEFKRTNPQLALWMTVKKELVGPNGAQYFNDGLKGTGLPKLKGKLISQAPAARPKELVIALATADTPEIKLKLDTAMANKADPGTEIEFDGAIPAEFTSEPFLLTCDIEKGKVTGWPAPPPKPVGKATAGKKGAAKKK